MEMTLNYELITDWLSINAWQRRKKIKIMLNETLLSVKINKKNVISTSSLHPLTRSFKINSSLKMKTKEKNSINSERR